MSSSNNFFDDLDRHALKSDRRARLEAELRAHLEDAGATDPAQAEQRLGKPAEIADCFNQVALERDWALWGIAALLLSFFALVER